jgi:hypothetical protein
MGFHYRRIHYAALRFRGGLNPRGVSLARWTAAATRQRPLTSRVRHIHQLTAVIFCSLALSLLHHSANAGNCRTAETSFSVAACGCTGCHSVHGEARSTQKGSLCRGQHACARTTRRICTPTSTLPSLRLHPHAGRNPLFSRSLTVDKTQRFKT